MREYQILLDPGSRPVFRNLAGMTNSDKTFKWKVPFFDLDLGEEEYSTLKKVLDSRWLTMGPVTRDFESAFAEYLGVEHAIAVSSGTAAMHLAHHAVGLGQGDTAVCPSLTFVATANAISYTGATPIFADINSLDDPTISPEDIESRIHERTKVIVAVHYAGFPCDMDRIMDIANKHNLYVVEDAAHAIGATYSSRLDAVDRSPLSVHSKSANEATRTADTGQQTTENTHHPGPRPLSADPRRPTPDRRPLKAGSIGDLGCFSFFSNKNMTTAEGGMVVTNRQDLAEKVRTARSHGMTTLTWDRYKGQAVSYDVVGPGFNYRMDEMRAGLGLVQLGKLDSNNQQRGALWSQYREKLKDIEEIEVPFSNFSGTSSCHIFPILVSDRVDRDGLMQYLREKGIQTSIHYPPIHLFTYYQAQGTAETPLPLTEEVGKREVTLPLFPTMKERQVEYVVDTIKDYLVANL